MPGVWLRGEGGTGRHAPPTFRIRVRVRMGDGGQTEKKRETGKRPVTPRVSFRFRAPRRRRFGLAAPALACFASLGSAQSQIARSAVPTLRVAARTYRHSSCSVVSHSQPSTPTSIAARLAVQNSLSVARASSRERREIVRAGDERPLGEFSRSIQPPSLSRPLHSAGAAHS
ncbi:hypothetical protein GY45DRAFT_793701 [Cubamyces sp. BRFM 1775]|nr:hypothetical protein GY45DRAFT_793701 [Cubamyces sp. BRFM 1775]